MPGRRRGQVPIAHGCSSGWMLASVATGPAREESPAMSATPTDLSMLLQQATTIAAPLRDRLQQALMEPGSGAGALGPPHTVAQMLQALAQLDADGDTVAAALLHTYPALQARLGPSLGREHPAVVALLDGQRAAAQVWALHA